MPNLINLKELFGKRHRITNDPAVIKGHPDPQYYVIPCQHGEFQALDHEWIGFMCTSRIQTRKIVEAMKDKIRFGQGIDEDGPAEECVIMFKPEDFKQIAAFAKPRKRRVLTDEQKQALIEAGKGFQAVKGQGILLNTQT
jgi:hypothetical protein